MPVWFLILSLFLPRIALFIDWLNAVSFPFPQPWSAVCWIFLPRVLVLVMIYRWQGFGPWFIVHLVVAVCVLLGGGKYARER